MNVGKLVSGVEGDLEAITGHCKSLEQRCSGLQSDLSVQSHASAQLEEETKWLSSRLDALQQEIEDLQRSSSLSQLKSEEAYDCKVRQLQELRATLEANSRTMEGEVSAMKAREAELSALVGELQQKHAWQQAQLETQGQQHRREQAQLASAQHSLERQLAGAEERLEGTREALCDQTIQLNKSKALTLSLERRNKALQSKQSSLLARLDELDRECSCLRDGAAARALGSERLALELREAQGRFAEAQELLAKEQIRVESLTREHQELLAAVSHLESQVAEAKSLLEQERKNCKLLMDCPFVDPLKKESWEQLHSASVSDPKATRKQISANTVRILMLEEQNSELRSLSVRPGQRQTEQFEVKRPTQLWEQRLLDELQAARASAAASRGTVLDRRAFSAMEGGAGRHTPPPVQDLDKPTPSKLFASKSQTGIVTSTERVSRSSGGGSRALGGHLGHLVAAIADAHRRASDDKKREAASRSTGVGEAWPNSHSQEQDNNYQLDKEDSQLSVASSRSESLYGNFQVLMCRNCDRMFSSSLELEEHAVDCVEHEMH